MSNSMKIDFESINEIVKFLGKKTTKPTKEKTDNLIITTSIK